MENKDEITRVLADPQYIPEASEVLGMIESDPTFILPAILLLKRAPESVDNDTRRRLQAYVTLNCPDRTALADLIDITDSGWADFYPYTEPYQQSTEETIDDFINTYGAPGTAEEESLLERLIFNPVPADYFADTDEPFDPSNPLALPPELRPDSDETAPAETAEDTDNAENTENEPEGGKTAQTPPDESLLMESLAKIFIKQRRYERAYEIISKLSLNNPEKSVYFADQLRFLRKLIINQKFLTK